MSPLLAVILGLSFVLPTTFAFNWSYPLAPRQCSNFTVVVSNIGDVVFPLKVLIVPVGPSPLTYEVRKVIEVNFSGNTTTVSFQLPYPTGSTFVGLVSDASGYHGTASTWTVGSSDDATCFDATKDAAPSSFTFSLSPKDVAECQDVRIYWPSGSVRGLPFFFSVIPGSTFGPILLGKIEDQAGLGTGFTWRPPVRAGTNLIIVGGDSRGADAGGFVSAVVIPGNPNRDATGGCPAPSATTSVIAATSLIVSTTTLSATNAIPIGAGSPPNVGAVVGGVVGGVAILGLVIFIFHRLLRNKAEPQVIVPYTQQHAPVAPAPSYYGDKLFSPSHSVPMPMSPQPQESIVPQETGEPLPMYISYIGHSGTGLNKGP